MNQPCKHDKKSLEEFDNSYLDSLKFIDGPMKNGFMYVIGHKVHNHMACVGKESFDNYMAYFNEKYPGNEEILKESLEYFLDKHKELR